MQVSTGLIHGYAVESWDDLSTYLIEAERMGVHRGRRQEFFWPPWTFNRQEPAGDGAQHAGGNAGGSK